MELPDSYSSKLVEAAARGDYMLTHALLAWIWIQENSCEVELPEGFTGNLYRANAALINNDSVVTDLELEAAAFLYLAGQHTLVSTAFAQRVIASQNGDGGWLLTSDKPGNSDWHPTVLALFVLSQLEYPAVSYVPMLAGK